MKAIDPSAILVVFTGLLLPLFGEEDQTPIKAWRLNTPIGQRAPRMKKE
jgi:hypothetical protein